MIGKKYLEIVPDIWNFSFIPKWAKTKNPLPFLPIFSVPEVTKLTLPLFFDGINLAFFLFFGCSAIVHQSNKWVKGKWHLVNKIFSFVIHLKKKKKKIQVDYEVFQSNQYTVYNGLKTIT